MFNLKKKKSKNIYSDYLKSDTDTKKNSMKKLFDGNDHASTASNRCATNRKIQSQVKR